MSNTSKKHFDENFKKEIWEDFSAKFLNKQSIKEREDFVKKFLGPEEFAVFEKRVIASYLLNKGVSYRKIGELVDVAPSTISFVKKGCPRINKKEKSANNSNLKKRFVDKNYKSEKSKKSNSRFPTYRGSGRWRFLNG